jgi:hypothetical protein
MSAWVSGCLVMVAALVWFMPVESAARRLQATSSSFEAKPSLTVILEMLAVAMREGSSIPYALEVIGSIVGESLGAGLCKAANSLMQGYSWQDAWLAASLACQQQEGRENRLNVMEHSGKSTSQSRDDHDCASNVPVVDEGALAIIRDALEPSWSRGVSPVGPLDSAVEQMDAHSRASIEQSAQRLSVKLLLPTGLCFLPAFILIGVIPAIGSFMG